MQLRRAIAIAPAGRPTPCKRSHIPGSWVRASPAPQQGRYLRRLVQTGKSRPAHGSPRMGSAAPTAGPSTIVTEDVGERPLRGSPSLANARLSSRAGAKGSVRDPRDEDSHRGEEVNQGPPRAGLSRASAGGMSV